MKFSLILPFAALSTALVFPPEEVLSELAIEDHHSQGWKQSVVATKDRLVSEFDDLVDTVDDEIEIVKDDFESVKDKVTSGFTDFFEGSREQAHDAWSQSKHSLNHALSKINDQVESLEEEAQELTPEFDAWINEHGSFDMFDEHHHPPPPPHHPPHHPPPHHPPPHHPPGHGPPDHHRPHHPKHPHCFNATVYELIARSNYTTKLAKLINEYPDLVKALNSTKANYTVFAPTDKAFEKIPEKAPKPSKKDLERILMYHVLPDFYPALRVLSSHTAPTLLSEESLGKDNAQRIAFKLGLRGLTVNFHSRIIAVNIFGTNGVIHGIDYLILPPPQALSIVSHVPGTFSTLELGLLKTGLYDELNTTDHAGGTLFAPTNSAFEKLGPRINAFLFSKYGEKFLKALLEYHVAPGHVLYSDMYYETKGSDADADNFPRGRFHFDLPTLLKDRSLAVDIARFGGFITMKINAFTTVAYQDLIAKDGVVHVMSRVLIPPKTVGNTDMHWDGEELSLEEFKARLEPFVKSDL